MNTVKNKLFLIFLALFTIFHFQSFGQTQHQMDSTAEVQTNKADKELNSVYQQILQEYATQPMFLKKLKVAQRLWIQLRDAELAAMFPDQGGGSVEPMCEAAYLETLTRDRIKYLKVWLDGIPEGDACRGSVKINTTAGWPLYN